MKQLAQFDTVFIWNTVGDLVLKEKPTVTCSGHHPFTNLQLSEIQRNIELLSSPDRKAFFAMANSIPEPQKLPRAALSSQLNMRLDASSTKPSQFEDHVIEAAGIFITNSFDMTDSPLGEACAMYCAIGRLNHSCYPNVQVI